MKRPVLVEYRGGGYDGCFWEYNYFYMDPDEQFVDIYSSGYNGCETLEAFRSRCQDGLKVSTFYLDTPFDWQILSEIRCLYMVRALAEKLEELTGEEIQAECPYCGNDTYLGDIEIVGEKGNGGIGVIGTDWACQDCYTCNTCAECGWFVNPNDDQVEPLDPEGHCQYCSSWQFDLDDPDSVAELIQANPELAPLVRERFTLDHAIGRHTRNKPLYNEAFGEDKAEHYLSSARQRLKALEDDIKDQYWEYC